MIPVLTAIAILLFSVNLVLNLPKTVDLIQASAFGNNDQAMTSQAIAGIEKKVIVPVSKGMLPPNLTAASAIVYDLKSNTVIFAKDPNARVPIASTTKLMTALVGGEVFKPNDILRVTQDSEVVGSTMGLKAGEQLTYRSLLYGMLLNSGNDAAFTIAANFSGGVRAFVDKMNQRAGELGLSNSHFTNPAGFDDPLHFSSAEDLLKIAQKVAVDPQLSRVVSTKTTSVSSTDKAVIHQLKNLNKLLDLPGVIGMKTGFTPIAKENLVSLIERDEHKIITVVLGSDDRFGETTKLIDWAYQNFIWE